MEQFDETLPLMPDVNDSWEDEEKVKMDRLRASFSLLGVEEGPRIGSYSPKSKVERHHQESSPTSRYNREII